MFIDTHELIVELKEQGIQLESHLTEGRVLVSLTNLVDGTPIGIAVTSSAEKSLAVLIRRLADNKIISENLNEDKGLTYL